MVKFLLPLALLLSACVSKEDRKYRNITVYCNGAPPLSVDSVHNTVIYRDMGAAFYSIYYVQGGEDRRFSESATCSIRNR